jgi:hypothetical protein
MIFKNQYVIYIAMAFMLYILVNQEVKNSLEVQKNSLRNHNVPEAFFYQRY